MRSNIILLNKNLSNLKKENIFEIAKNSINKEKLKLLSYRDILIKLRLNKNTINYF